MVRLSALEQQVRDKDEIISNLNGLLESERKQKLQFEQTNQLLKSNLEKSESKLRECLDEINKGNELVKQLQTEIRSNRGKMKAKLTTISQQEQTLEQKQQVSF